MRPRIVDWLNQYFDTGIFTYLIPNYTVMFSLALIIVLFLFIDRIKKENLDVDVALRLYFWAIIGIVAGGKLYGILLMWLQHGELIVDIFHPSRIGMFSMGGVIGGVIMIIYYAFVKKIPVVYYLDVAALYAGVAVCLMRIGCFLNGDDYGRVSFLPWAVQYPAGSYPHQDQVALGLIKYDSSLSLPLHPVQLYLSAAGLLTVGILLWARKYVKVPGGMFALLLTLYFLFRFVLEYFRGDPMRFAITHYSDAQFLALIIVPIAILFLVAKRKSIFATNVQLK